MSVGPDRGIVPFVDSGRWQEAGAGASPDEEDTEEGARPRGRTFRDIFVGAKSIVYMAGRFRATASHDVTQTPVRIEGVPFDSKTNQGIGYQVKTNDSLTVYLDEATVAAVPNPDGEHPVAQVGLFNAFGGFTGDMLVTQPPQGKPTGE